MKPRDYLNKAKESLNSRDVHLQLMPLDLAWRSVCMRSGVYYICLKLREQLCLIDV